ncbi:MAG: type I-C CRISPR-associated protein Cas7/Csd2 [Clostridiales bacterium]|nr:type I-C CRISPR-associated protein Cas7/Csd2 [Clostridiales bacterium]
MAIKNRYEFIYYVSCTNSNPNGDPDMGNTPRIDPQTMKGYITDVATKRRIRNYVSTAYENCPGMDIIIRQSSNLNRRIAEARQAAGFEGCTNPKNCAKAKSCPKAGNCSEEVKNAVAKGRQKACEMFYDVRTFGAVMSTGPNAGQVRGPVQVTFGKSLDTILPQDISVTRMASTDKLKNNIEETVKNYIEQENSTSEDKLRTMGRKQFIPFGLYEVRGFISANLAAETGFDDEYLKILFEAILNMYEHDHSASKGEMAVVSPLIIFKHVGTDTDEAQRSRQAKLGCAPAHKLFSLVDVKKKPEVDFPRSFTAYDATVNIDKVPEGVEIGFQTNPNGSISWGSLPDDESWFHCE